MKSSKQFKNSESHVTLSKDTIEELAIAIGKVISKLIHNLPIQSNQTIKQQYNKEKKEDTFNPFEIDERLVDVGVSTVGITKANDSSLANETVKKDNVSSSVNKLKNLKNKG